MKISFKTLLGFLMWLPVSIAFADMYPIGSSFGSHGEFQLGLDRMPAIGGCVLNERMDAQFLAGPCIDPLLLTRNGQPIFSLGAGVLYNAERGNPTYNVQLGFIVGPLAKQGIGFVVDRIPVVERVTHIELPGFFIQLADATRLYVSAGPRPIHTKDVKSDFTAGFGFRVDCTNAVEYVAGLLKAGLSYGPNHDTDHDLPAAGNGE